MRVWEATMIALRRTPLRALLTPMIVVGLLSACATGPISSAPFEQLAASMQQVRTGADAALGSVYDRMRDRYIAEAAAGDAEKVQGLLLTRPPDDPFGWATPNPPLFLTTAQFRDGVYRFNSALIQYATLLNQLAAKDLVDPKTFSQLATDLNGNVKSAAAALGVSAPGREIAIFSTLATAAFEAYLRHQQRSALLKALRENQPTIQSTAELGAQATRLTAAALRNEYDERSVALARTASAAAIRELADLDDRFIKEIAALRVLHDTYVALPSAHRDLAAGLEDPKLGFAAIRDLFQYGQDLYRRYEELAAKDKAAK
jgi:hypothetical protein